MYVLVFNPVEGRTLYASCPSIVLKSGRMLSECGVIVSDWENILDGVRYVNRVLSKRWSPDAIWMRIVRAIMGLRWCAERYAPKYKFTFIAPEYSFVDLGDAENFFDIKIVMADLVRETESSANVVPLFKLMGVDLQTFLAGERQFAKALTVLLTKLATLELDISSMATNAFNSMNMVTERIVSSTPSALDILSMIMQKYNVSGRDIINYVAREIKAELSAAGQKPESETGAEGLKKLLGGGES